ncbi:hypothetical protein [Tissierella pigra]|uniref:Uncharacterized protein n=1 Tax=Tissierella pigra TaxID=2607614 RepID=A0A6N7XID9_9FIRM|nr:hypothetical protein [Tissierella pigra]MSU01406.1 hypothetical protein [Tissierella pigra]
MFYDKEISILSDNSYMDDYGLLVEGQSEVIKTIQCDVQPHTQKMNYRDFSYDKDAKYKVFCDPEELLKLGTQVSYKNNIYYIVEIKDWDDYLILLLDDKKVT